MEEKMVKIVLLAMTITLCSRPIDTYRKTRKSMPGTGPLQGKDGF